MTARFWQRNAEKKFADFLDEVEAGLRAKPSIKVKAGKAAKLVETAKE